LTSVASCVFCQIIAGRAPADIVRREDRVVAFRDLHPVAPTHILIVPVKHVVSLTELQAEDQAVLGSLFMVARSLAAEEKIDQSGYRLVVNTGAGGGQSVFHLHLHLIGGRPMRWPPG
jgi:histidine triad (HIT) family protein